MALKFKTNSLTLILWLFAAAADASQLAYGERASSSSMLTNTGRPVVHFGGMYSRILPQFASTGMSLATPAPALMPSPTASPLSSAKSFRARAGSPWQTDEDLRWSTHLEMVLTTPEPVGQQIEALTKSQHTEQMSVDFILPCIAMGSVGVICLMRPRGVNVASDEKDESPVENVEIGRPHGNSNHTTSRSSRAPTFAKDECWQSKQDSQTKPQDQASREEDTNDPTTAGKSIVSGEDPGKTTALSQCAVREEDAADPQIADKTILSTVSVSSQQAVCEADAADTKIAEMTIVSAVTVSSQQVVCEEDANDTKIAEHRISSTISVASRDAVREEDAAHPTIPEKQIGSATPVPSQYAISEVPSQYSMCEEDAADPKIREKMISRASSAAADPETAEKTIISTSSVSTQHAVCEEDESGLKIAGKATLRAIPHDGASASVGNDAHDSVVRWYSCSCDGTGHLLGCTCPLCSEASLHSDVEVKSPGEVPDVEGESRGEKPSPQQFRKKGGKSKTTPGRQ